MSHLGEYITFVYNTLIFTVSEQQFFLFGSWRNVKNGMLLETTVSNANWIKERTIRQKGREILLWTMDKMEYKFYYAFSVVLYALISEMIEDFFFILSWMKKEKRKKKKRYMIRSVKQKKWNIKNDTFWYF